jgi:anti-anti-sigma factor
MPVQPVPSYLNVRRRGQVTDVTLINCSNLSDGNILAVKDQLLELSAGLADCHLFLDCTYVDAMSSEALGALLEVRKALLAISGTLTLCNLTVFVEDVFAVTRLNTLFDIWAGPYVPAGAE